MIVLINLFEESTRCHQTNEILFWRYFKRKFRNLWLIFTKAKNMLINGIFAVPLVAKIHQFGIKISSNQKKNHTIAMDLSPTCCSLQLHPANVTIIFSQLT